MHIFLKYYLMETFNDIYYIIFIDINYIFLHEFKYMRCSNQITVSIFK